MHGKSFKTVFIVATIINIAIAAPQPGDKSELSNVSSCVINYKINVILLIYIVWPRRI